uniref:Uncharacterized protein n=2 Tax=environmental samples TaxID=48479 RepID=A0A0H3U9P4_9BACT|nr:hypothetical protein [uncultured bacterium Ele45G2]AIF26548.1 hypothetical protein [uncultured bacterium fosmid pJB45G2]
MSALTKVAMLEPLNDAFVTQHAREPRRRHATVTCATVAVPILPGLLRPYPAGRLQGARMRTESRALGRLLSLLLAAMLMHAPVSANDTQVAPAAKPSAKPAGTSDGACIDTEVNGYRALSYDCLNQKMAPAATARPAPQLESEAITQRPPNQMGLPTPATIGNRMGNTFGTSAYPQRPPR